MSAKSTKQTTAKGETQKRKLSKKLTVMKGALEQNKTDLDLRIADLRQNLHELELVSQVLHHR